MNCIVQLMCLADTLDRKGFYKLANQVDDILSEIVNESDGSIDFILNSYRAMHKMAETRKANIRKRNECPFCLDIPQACSTTGDSVLIMKVGECDRNKKIHQLQSTGLKCKYASKILSEHDAVECNYGSTTEGVAVPKIFRSSPIYPKLWEGFNTVNLDRNYHQYSDFNYYSIYG